MSMGGVVLAPLLAPLPPPPKGAGPPTAPHARMCVCCAYARPACVLWMWRALWTCRVCVHMCLLLCFPVCVSLCVARQTLEGGSFLGTFPVPIVRAIAALLYRRCDLCKKKDPVTEPFNDTFGVLAHRACLVKCTTKKLDFPATENLRQARAPAFNGRCVTTRRSRCRPRCCCPITPLLPCCAICVCCFCCFCCSG